MPCLSLVRSPSTSEHPWPFSLFILAPSHPSITALSCLTSDSSLHHPQSTLVSSLPCLLNLIFLSIPLPVAGSLPLQCCPDLFSLLPVTICFNSSVLYSVRLSLAYSNVSVFLASLRANSLTRFLYPSLALSFIPNTLPFLNTSQYKSLGYFFTRPLPACPCINAP